MHHPFVSNKIVGSTQGVCLTCGHPIQHVNHLDLEHDRKAFEAKFKGTALGKLCGLDKET